MKEFYNSLWTDMPEAVREKIRIADNYGLYHNHNYLRTLGPKKVCSWEANIMGKFADRVVTLMCKIDIKDSNDILLNSIKNLNNTQFNSLNATALGGIAYISINHPNTEVKEKYAELLTQIKDHFNSYGSSHVQ